LKIIISLQEARKWGLFLSKKLKSFSKKAQKLYGPVLSLNKNGKKVRIAAPYMALQSQIPSFLLHTMFQISISPQNHSPLLSPTTLSLLPKVESLAPSSLAPLTLYCLSH